MAFPSRALQGIFEVESHDLAIAMFLSRSENKDGEHLDTIPVYNSNHDKINLYHQAGRLSMMTTSEDSKYIRIYA